MLQQSATGLIKNSKSRVYYVDMWSGEVLEQQHHDLSKLTRLEADQLHSEASKMGESALKVGCVARFKELDKKPTPPPRLEQQVLESGSLHREQLDKVERAQDKLERWKNETLQLEQDNQEMVTVLNQLDKKHFELVDKLQREAAHNKYKRNQKPRFVLEDLLSGKIDSIEIDVGGCCKFQNMVILSGRLLISRNYAHGKILWHQVELRLAPGTFLLPSSGTTMNEELKEEFQAAAAVSQRLRLERVRAKAAAAEAERAQRGAAAPAPTLPTCNNQTYDCSAPSPCSAHLATGTSAAEGAPARWAALVRCFGRGYAVYMSRPSYDNLDAHALHEAPELALMEHCRSEGKLPESQTAGRSRSLTLPGTVADFVVLNMVCNEKFGEVTVVGHRLSVQQIVNIAQVWYSDVEGARRIDLTYDSVQPDILVTDEFFESIHVHPVPTARWRIFLDSDTIYTVPDVEKGEYSAAGSGGIQLSLPDPLLDPVINFNGALEVDECTDAHFDVSDTTYMGPDGYGTYEWELLGYTDTIEKLTGPDPYNETLFQFLNETFVNANADNTGILTIPTEYMMPAFSFNIQLTATSWWGVSTVLTFTLLKLNYQSPIVTILGTTEVTYNRTQSFSIIAVGQPSECQESTTGLTYTWTDLTGQLDFAAEGIFNNVRTLAIPAYTLHPVGTEGDDPNMYNFSVTVGLSAEFFSTATASAYVTVYVRRSPVFVVLAKEDHVMTLGNILVIDARSSLDDDYPTALGETFPGTFAYACLQADLTPCFGTDPDGLIGDTDSLPQCVTDFTETLSSGGSLFSYPVFDSMDLPYCRWARGVLMIDTYNLTAQDYDFTVYITSYDGRTADKSFTVTLTQLDVPSLIVAVIDPTDVSRFPVTEMIRLEGIVEDGLDPTVPVEFYWTLYEYTNNPEYDVDQAEEAAKNPSVIYNVDEFVFLDKSAEYNLDNTSNFVWNSLEPDMKILQNSLLPSRTYKFRLTLSINDGAVEGYSDVTFETAGEAPRNGILTVSPAVASLDQARVFSATGWQAEDLPLTYHFGYYAFFDGNMVSVKLTSDPLPVSSTTFDSMVLGEPSTNYTLTVSVEVCTTFLACTTADLVVQSMLPDDVAAYTTTLLDSAATADPETAVTNLMTAVSINTVQPAPAPGEALDAEQEALLTAVSDQLIEVMSTSPVTESTQIAQATVISEIIEAGLVTNSAVDALESMVNNAAEAEPPLFDINNPDLMQLAFGAINGILPQAPDTAAELPTGQSVTDFEAGIAAATNNVIQNQQMYSRSAMSTTSERQQTNHPTDSQNKGLINSCPTAYCDKLYLACVPAGTRLVYFTCCDTVNELTSCWSPPCWVSGNKCPIYSWGGSTERRLSSGWRRKVVPAEWGRKLSREFKFTSIPDHDPDSRSSNWSWRWGWPSERRLTDTNPYNYSSVSLALWQLEEAETFILPYAQAAQLARDRAEAQELDEWAQLEATWALQEQQVPGSTGSEREAAEQAEQLRIAEKYIADRQNSQTITRAAVLRDLICKTAIVQMGLNEAPISFSTSGFTLYFGKTTDMSSLEVPDIRFWFPSKYTIPPAFASEDNSFSFIYVEYDNNMYYWSDTTPPTDGSTRMISLMVMQANTVELQIENESEPIRIFIDEDLTSSGVCLFWDRFYPNTAGGAWSPVGLLNNGDGCWTTHLSDIAFFIDGRVPSAKKLASATGYYMDNLRIEAVSDVGTNFMQMALVGMVLLVGTISTLWGYIMDELHREKQRTGKLPRATIRLRGDGVNEARTTDDPIAYQHATNRQLFLAVTLWQVLKRDHAIFGPLFFHQTFTRPQRLMCIGVMVTGVMAVNALIYGEPDDLISADAYMAGGVLSALVVFPLYCIVCFMFANRPTRLRKRLIKKHTPTEASDAMSKSRTELEHKSMMRPPPNYSTLPALPQKQGIDAADKSLLMLRPPSLNTLPGMGTLQLPPAARLPVAGLPALPGAIAGPGPGALPSLPGLGPLPPLPAVNASAPALTGLPPLPRYPAPPSTAAATAQQPALPLPQPQAGAAPVPPLPQLGPPPSGSSANLRPGMLQGQRCSNASTRSLAPARGW
ncbi:unnamed protein product, partial [Prorocentrum cordatum]